jgi:hypothetical protein
MVSRAARPEPTGRTGRDGIAAWQRGHFTYPIGTATAHFGHGTVDSGLTLGAYPR